MTNEAKEAARPAQAGTGSRQFSHAWRALRHSNFRLFETGQIVSLTGTWITRIAIAWLVYRLTKSPWMLGAIGFTNQIPMFLLAPASGVLVDRMDRRKVLIGTQVLLMLHALLLCALTLSRTITIPLLFALSAAQGLINTFDMPARLSFFIRMVDGRDDLSNALAINASMSNSTRLIGPALGGILIAAAGEGWCFLIDGLSYIAVIASLLMMRMGPEEATPAGAGLVAQLREGWSYVSGSVPIRSILLLFVVISMMGWPFSVLMPIFAAQVLHGGPNTLGFLMSALGMGALAASLSLALRRSVRGLTGQLALGALAAGGGLICFGISHRLWLSLLLMLIAGFGLLRETIGTNIILQTLMEEKMRARVMSYYSMALEGLAPFGSLIAGGMAHAIGAQHAVMISGTACILGGLWFWMRLGRIRAAMRPIYESLGIIPKLTIAEGADD